MTRSKELLERAAAEAKSAREIAEKADTESRELTDDERNEYQKHFDAALKARDDAKVAQKDASLVDQARKMAEEIGLSLPTDAEAAGILAGDAGAKAPHLVPLAKMVLSSKEFKAMLDPHRASDGTVRVPEKARIQSDPINVKSLFVGGSDTSAGAFVVAEQTGIVEMLGRRALTLRDLISVRRTGSDTVEYVRQTSHTNAAAPVAEATSSAAPTAPATGPNPLVLNANGGYKPEGAWAFERDTATVKTIAEWVPATKRSLADVAALEGLIRDELVADLKEEEEDQILTGDGTGENLEGILTAPTQAQAWDTDLFTTVRKALTKARKVGRVIPNGIVLAPEDVERIDLTRDASGASANTGQYFGAGPFALGPRTLWGLPIVESEAMTPGVGLLGDFKKAVLWDREQASVTMTDSHADFFIRNLVAILAEERVAFAVTRPTAFVEMDLTA